MLQASSRSDFGSFRRTSRRVRRTWILFASVSAALILATLFGATVYGRRAAIDTIVSQSRTDASLKVALLNAVLERPRALPLLLAEDQQVLDGLSSNDSDAIDILNRKLERL